MTSERHFLINQYNFTPTLFEKLASNHYARNLWPLVYILSDDEVCEAYVGETTDTYARMGTHLKNDKKKRLTSVHLITSEKFNKSATLDIESNLIKYISGDGKYRLQNGNLGLANHNYFQKKEIYWDLFQLIWADLRTKGLTKHSIEYINNSDLFKYSPYKSLTVEQRKGLLGIINSLLSENIENVIVEGGAGTGKTILAIFLFKIINTNLEDFNFKEFGEDETEFVQLVKDLKSKFPNPKMALVVPMASFRSTLQKVFKNIKGLSANMVVGPSAVSKEKYDIVVVDESHRLRRRVNLGTYYNAFDAVCDKLGLDKMASNELEWILLQSKKSILFYDEDQSIKPSDTKKEDFNKVKRNEKTRIETLKSQFRVKGGNDYVKFVDQLLNCKLNVRQAEYNANSYEFLLFDSIKEMIDQIKQRDQEQGLSRIIAGYSWQWVSKKDKNAFDIDIDGVKFKWNGVSDDWINSENSINEVGCIHTTQGYDLNYAAVIFGNEISYNKEKNEIVILKENYFDKNGKHSIANPAELKEYIVNIYKTIMLRGIKGTYVYVCDKNLREYLSRYIPKTEKQPKIQYLPIEEVIAFENCIPIYDLKVAAGEFGQLQQMEDINWIPIPPGYKSGKDLFACTVVGESMNKIIPNGSICLFRKYSGGSRNGKIALVEHTDFHDSDFGSCYTVKEYHSSKKETDNPWEHDSIILKPLSYDPSYKDLVLQNSEKITYRVIGIFEYVLGKVGE